MGFFDSLVKKNILNMLSTPVIDSKYDTGEKVRQKLQLLTGFDILNMDDLYKAESFIKIKDGSEIKLFKNYLDNPHIFLLDPKGKIIYKKWFWLGDKEKAMDCLDEIRKIINNS